MNENTLYIETTRTGKPAFWVGGGAASNTFNARFIMRDGKLAPALFIRTSGPRCNGDQALVGLKIGDVYVGIDGRRPANPDNPDITIFALRIVGFGVDSDGHAIATCEDVTIDINDIPPSVWEGANEYHNREGRYFVADK